MRTDIHRLFDLGYATVTTDYKFKVGKRLREDYHNGKHYYEMNGQRIGLPDNLLLRPNKDFLEWHNQYVFKE